MPKARMDRTRHAANGQNHHGTHAPKNQGPISVATANRANDVQESRRSMRDGFKRHSVPADYAATIHDQALDHNSGGNTTTERRGREVQFRVLE